MRKKIISKKAIIFGILLLFIGVNVLQLSNTTVKADLSQGLVGYWSFNNGNANDESGNGHDGTLYGATSVVGKFGNGFSFDGNDDYIDLGDDPDFDITGSITIALWFKTSTSQMGCIVSKLDQVNPDNGYDLAMGDSFSTNPSGKITFRVASESNGPSEYDAAQTTNTYTDNTWHLLTVIYTPNGVSRPKIYIDAVEQSVSNSGIPLSSIGASPGFNLKLAEYSAGSGVFNFNGVLDEVRLYNRALTADEIHELYVPLTVYVDDGYSSSTPGWGYDHFSNIQAGVDAVDVGGTVYVNSGVYAETLGPHLAYIDIEKSLSLIGEKAESTVINCPSGETGILIGWPQDFSNINVSGFTVVGAYNPVSIGIYPQLNSNNIKIENCIVYGFGEGISVRGGSNNVIIRNCTVYDNSREGGICFRDGGNNYKVSDCNLYSNSYGIYILNVFAGTNYLIYHNNFYDNTINAYDTRSSQYWHNSLLQEGNYYDDYTGIDANGDGIGDTPYDIPGGDNQDLYPFMEQDGWLLPPNQPPVADAEGPYYANVGNSITFDGSGSSDTDGTIVGYRWDWTNDGTYDTEWLTSATTTHSYSSVGTYTVKLEVKDDDGGTDTDTATTYISTEGGAVPTADTNGPYSGYVNHPVFFNSAGSAGGSEGTITEWYWTFGDGTVSSQQNPTHTYTSSGTFTVTLKVTNNFGQTNTDTTSATIQELSPDQNLPVADAGGPYSGVVGTPITFDGSGSNDEDGTIVSYVWNFGDSTTGTGVSPTHTYTIPGNYSVILTVTDNESLTHSNSTIARINVSGPPTIVISVDLSNIEPIVEGNEKTITVNVFCYHQAVSNIHIDFLEWSNLTVNQSSPNISLNPGERGELLIRIKAPILENKNNSDDNTSIEILKFRANGDGNVTSENETINIIVAKLPPKIPGFETIATFTAVGSAGALVTFFRRRNRNR